MVNETGTVPQPKELALQWGRDSTTRAMNVRKINGWCHEGTCEGTNLIRASGTNQSFYTDLKEGRNVLVNVEMDRYGKYLLR